MLSCGLRWPRSRDRRAEDRTSRSGQDAKVPLVARRAAWQRHVRR